MSHVPGFYTVGERTFYGRGSCRINEKGLRNLRRTLFEGDMQELARLRGLYHIQDVDLERIIEYIQQTMGLGDGSS